MGLADFLVDAGRGTPYARVGAAMGGNGGKTMQDAFIDDQLPALTDQLHKAQTKKEILKVGQAMISGGLKAGMRPDGLQRIMEMTIGPALHGMPNEELNKLRDQYAGQPAVPGESRPQGTEGPLTPSGNFIDPKAATPDKPLDLNFMMKFGQATGANPEQFNKMLETPSAMAGHQLSNQKTQQAIDAETAKEKTIQGLPNTPTAEGQPSQQAVARVPGLAQFLDARGKPEDPLQDKRSEVMDAQIRNLNHMADRPFPDPNAGADKNRTRQATVLRKEFTTLSKNFRDVGDSYNRIDAATKSNDPMSQVAAIYNFIKMQDPNIVTGSEFNLIQNARPLLAKYGLQSFERAWSGKRLDPEQVTQLRNSAKNLYDASARQHQQRVQEYTRLAEQSDINPRDVITEMGVQPAQEGQGGYSGGAPSGSGSGGATGQGGGAPAVGTVSKGYRFKGGNPADRNSWEKVQ